MTIDRRTILSGGAVGMLASLIGCSGRADATNNGDFPVRYTERNGASD